jgi:hypothetical protein
VEETRDLFTRLEMKLPDDYSDEDVASIVTQAVNANDPYT